MIQAGQGKVGGGIENSRSDGQSQQKGTAGKFQKQIGGTCSKEQIESKEKGKVDRCFRSMQVHEIDFLFSIL